MTAFIDPALLRPASPGAAPPAFALFSADTRLVGQGPATPLPRGTVESLGQRVRDAFAAAPDGGTVAGILPFDRADPDHLVHAARLGTELPLHPGDDAGPTWSLRPDPAPAAYADAVARALALMDGSGAPAALRKVVLARSLLAEADRPIDLLALLHRLRADGTATAFLVPLPPGADAAPRHMVGATPELLVSRSGRTVLSHPLAGSARRDADPAADEAARLSLVQSDKDWREHALVSEFVLDTLAPFCRGLSAPEGAVIRATETMWHLGTRIEGELRDPDVSAADLAAVLHPTPAVCGVPRERAAALIPELEGFPRGFYGGAVGWCDRAGDGAWHVAIRCAEVSGRRARLFAGAGIVPGSCPDGEVQETDAKFAAMLRALGIAGAGA